MGKFNQPLKIWLIEVAAVHALTSRNLQLQFFAARPDVLAQGGHRWRVLASGQSAFKAGDCGSQSAHARSEFSLGQSTQS